MNAIAVDGVVPGVQGLWWRIVAFLISTGQHPEGPSSPSSTVLGSKNPYSEWFLDLETLYWDS